VFGSSVAVLAFSLLAFFSAQTSIRARSNWSRNQIIQQQHSTAPNWKNRHSLCGKNKRFGHIWYQKLQRSESFSGLN
jgi:hypothetical protein